MNLNSDIEINLVKATDAWKICNFIVSNEDRFKTYLPETLAQNLTPTLSELFVKQKLKFIQAEEEFLYTIKSTLKRDLIGLAYVKQIDLQKRQVEFAYAIDYKYTGQGIIPFTIKQLISNFKDRYHIKTFQIVVNKDNNPSIRVAEKNGFQWIKTLPEIFKPKGRPPMDMELYELQLEQ